MQKIIINSLLTIYLGIGAYAILSANLLLGGIYIILLLFSIILVSYSYCTKCSSCQKKCAHPQIGLIRKYLPHRIKVDYKFYDYVGIIPYIIIAQFIPQYWLWQNKIMFAIYWILSILVLSGILVSLCRSCENKFCKLNRNPKFK